MSENRSERYIEEYRMVGEGSRFAHIIFKFENGKRVLEKVQYGCDKSVYDLTDWQFLHDIYLEIKEILG